jgi:hypothetical protein
MWGWTGNSSPAAVPALATIFRTGIGSLERSPWRTTTLALKYGKAHIDKDEHETHAFLHFDYRGVDSALYVALLENRLRCIRHPFDDFIVLLHGTFALRCFSRDG